jgi:hypothetical protein
MIPGRTIVGRDAETVQEMPRETLGLHVSEIQAQAHMGAAAELHESKLVPREASVRGPFLPARNDP